MVDVGGEGAVRVQAMEQNRDDPQRIEPRSLPDRRPSGTPESDDVMRWVAAGIVSAAALLGLVVLVAFVAYWLQPPRWLQIVLGVAMAAGTAVFAWLLATALRKDDASDRSSRRR